MYRTIKRAPFPKTKPQTKNITGIRESKRKKSQNDTKQFVRVRYVKKTHVLKGTATSKLNVRDYFYWSMGSTCSNRVRGVRLLYGSQSDLSKCQWVTMTSGADFVVCTLYGRFRSCGYGASVSGLLSSMRASALNFVSFLYPNVLNGAGGEPVFAVTL